MDDDDRDVLNAEISQVLPFLFLGSERDSLNDGQLKRLQITDVLNVTAKLPDFLNSELSTSLSSTTTTTPTNEDSQDIEHQAGQANDCDSGTLAQNNIIVMRNRTYKWLPAFDSYQQNLKQHFDEAFQFIGKLMVRVKGGNGWMDGGTHILSDC